MWAWLVVPLVVAALAVALAPVRNGRVQNCGTPLAFIAAGRAEAPLPDVDRPGVADDPPTRFTEAEYRDAAIHPCRERAGNRMAWAAGLVALAMLCALLGVIATLVGRFWLGRAPAADEPVAGDQPAPTPG